MFRRWLRYMPFAIVVWLAKRNLERFRKDGFVITQPFRGELVAWPEDRP